jgi:chromosome segregation ATPase
LATFLRAAALEAIGVSVQLGSDALTERVEALATWINDLDAQIRAVSVTADKKALKELAKALEAWAKHDPKLEERITNRVDVLADRFATLAGTVNTTAAALAGKDGEIAQLRRELEEGNARLEEVVRELRRSGPGADVAELRRAVNALTAQRTTGSSDSRVGALAGEVDVLAQRLDTLSKTVSTTAASLAGKEGELAALRARLEEGDHQAESVVAELRASVSELSLHVAGLGDRTSDPQIVRVFENHLLDLTGRVEQLAAQLDDVSTAVEATADGLAANELELASVQERFGEASARVETMVSELRDVVAELPQGTAADVELTGRLELIGRQVDELADQLAGLNADSMRRWDEAAAATAHVEQLLADVGIRVADVEAARSAAAAELELSSEAWAEERSWVRRQLEILAAAVEDVRPTELVEPKLQELAGRVASMEQGHEVVGREVARIAAAWEAEREALKSELDVLAASVAAAPASHVPAERDEDAERLLAELSARLERMEREGSAAAAEIARVEAVWRDEIGSLEARLQQVAGEAAAAAAPAGDHPSAERLEELALRLDAVERDLDRPAAGTPGDAEELHDIRVLINGLRMRLASNEKELAALSGSGDIVARLDDLSVRLGLLERAAATAPPPQGPVPGDGRFRVELRGLDLRMQQLEAAARENRDAVLMQFERLASRLQWRLQQLETESTDPGYGSTATTSPQLGQVVPIRSDG